MWPIKQSTAITVPFFVHDANGDAVLSLTDGSFTKRISKNGAAFGAMTVTITELENGWYSIPLSTAHSDTLGLLSILFTNAGAKQVNLQGRVSVRIPDDLAYPTTTGRSIAVTAAGEVGLNLNNTVGTLDAAQFGADFITGAKIAPGAIAKGDQLTGLNDIASPVTVGTINANALNAAAIAANAITAAKIAASALDGKGDWNIGKTGYALSAAGVDAIIDETLTSHVTVDSLGVAIKDILADTNELQTDDIPGSLTTLQSDTDDIQTRLPAALVGGGALRRRPIIRFIHKKMEEEQPATAFSKAFERAVLSSERQARSEGLKQKAKDTGLQGLGKIGKLSDDEVALILLLLD